MQPYKGYVIDLIKYLEKDLMFKAELYLVKDGLYGAFDANTREWNGMVGDVHKGVSNVYDSISKFTFNFNIYH